MSRYDVTLTENEIKELKGIIKKGGKGYRIKHAQALLKLDKNPNNADWTYDRIQEAYGMSRATVAGIAKRFVYGRDGICPWTQVAEKQATQSDRGCGSQNLRHSLFGTTGREHALDHAGNCR